MRGTESFSLTRLHNAGGQAPGVSKRSTIKNAHAHTHTRMRYSPPTASTSGTPFYPTRGPLSYLRPHGPSLPAPNAPSQAPGVSQNVDSEASKGRKMRGFSPGFVTTSAGSSFRRIVRNPHPSRNPSPTDMGVSNRRSATQRWSEIAVALPPSTVLVPTALTNGRGTGIPLYPRRSGASNFESLPNNHLVQNSPTVQPQVQTM